MKHTIYLYAAKNESTGKMDLQPSDTANMESVGWVLISEHVVELDVPDDALEIAQDKLVKSMLLEQARAEKKAADIQVQIDALEHGSE